MSGEGGNTGSGGTGTGGSGSGAGGGSGTNGGGNPPTAADWLTGLNEDSRGYAELKGFKDPGSVLESYRNLEKLTGVPKERLLKLPEKDEDPAWGEVYTRLGRPAKPEEYGIEAAKEGGDPAFAEWARKAFHGQNLTKKQAQSLATQFNEYAASVQKSQETKLTQDLQAQDQALRGEWGAAYDQNADVVDKAAEAFGVDEKQLKGLRDALGGAGAMKFLFNIGSKLGEGTFVTGGKSGGMGPGVLSPAGAKAKISQLQGDVDFRKRLLNGDAQAKKEWDDLHLWMVS